MLKEYIQAPYIVLPFGLPKPALVITIMYLSMLIVFILYELKKGLMKVAWHSMDEMQQGEKNKLLSSVVGFITMNLSCIILPYFMEEENIIINIAETYLQYEILLFECVFLFLCTALLNKINPDKQIIASNKVLIYLIWISIGSGLLTNQMDYKLWQNKIVIICAWGLIYLFSTLDIEMISEKLVEPNRFDLVHYTPVQEFDELFPQHKMQAEDIANIILNSSVEPFSLCISGKWGEGKTSIVHGVIDILKHQKEYDLAVIYINALELDNKQAMIEYLFSQIKENLISRGVYVGIDSEFKDFISSSASAVTSDSIGDFIQKKFFDEVIDYQSQKRELEKVLQRTFKNGKVIVVVDDIERCNKATALEYLFLIKEVATMRNCVSIFVTDYNMLNNLVSDDVLTVQSSDTSDFLNKFFNYRIELRNELPESIFEKYDYYFKNDDPAYQCIYQYAGMSPGTWYQKVITHFNSQLEKEMSKREKNLLSEERRKGIESNIKRIESHLSLFNTLIKNPRNVAKFYNIFRNNVVVCNTLIMRLTTDESKIQKYIRSRNIGQILFVLSFVEIFLPCEYQHLVREGMKYAEAPLYGIDTTVSEEKSLLLELFRTFVYEEISDHTVPNSYIKEDRRIFAETFLTDKNNLPLLVNQFSSREEKWITALNEFNVQTMKENWIDMVLMIMKENLNEYLRDIEDISVWRIRAFSKLLDIAEQQVEMGEWTSDMIFAIFDSKMSADRLLPTRTGLLSTFWEHLRESTVYQKPTENAVKEMKRFPYHYTYSRTDYIYRLARLLIPCDVDQEKISDLREYLMNTNRTYGENMSIFLDKLTKYIPDCSLGNGEWIEKYEKLAERIKKYLQQYDIAEYPDMKNDIELMMDSIQEFSSLESIINWIEKNYSNANMLPTQYKADNTEEYIKYFECAFSSKQNITSEIEKQFRDYFSWLESERDIEINEQQIKKLHELVTIFVEQTGYISTYYRKVLLDLTTVNRYK